MYLTNTLQFLLTYLWSPMAFLQSPAEKLDQPHRYRLRYEHSRFSRRSNRLPPETAPRALQLRVPVSGNDYLESSPDNGYRVSEVLYPSYNLGLPGMDVVDTRRAMLPSLGFAEFRR